jgi:hypothetical protein
MVSAAPRRSSRRFSSKAPGRSAYSRQVATVRPLLRSGRTAAERTSAASGPRSSTKSGSVPSLSAAASPDRPVSGAPALASNGPGPSAVCATTRAPAKPPWTTAARQTRSWRVATSSAVATASLMSARVR